MPEEPSVADLPAANQAATRWCAEVNAVVHSQICAVPAERLDIERALLAPLPCCGWSSALGLHRPPDVR